MTEHVFRAYAPHRVEDDVAPRCFFVADDATERDVLARFLSAFGVHTTCAEPATTSDDVVRCGADLVLLDVAAPDPLLWALIDDRRCTSVGRVVVLPFAGHKARVAELMKLCVDAVLVKVFEPAQLVEVLREVARIARRRRSGAALVGA